MHRGRWILGLGALTMLAAGCGSTVKTGTSHGRGDSGLSVAGGAQGTVGGQASTPTSVAGTGSASGVGGGSASGSLSGSTAGGAGSSGGGQSGSSGSGSNGQTPTSSVSSKLVPASAPGVTAKTIYVGIGYSSQEGAGDKAIGAAGAAPSYDARNVVNAAVDYANSHGGFAGRKLQPLFYDYNLTTDTNTQDQSSCAYFTQDNKVFALEGGTDILDACGQKAGSVVYGAGSATEATFKQYPNLVDPESIALDRLGAVTATGLYKAGYFTGKLGLVTWDDPNYRATITGGYLPVLSAHHITPAQIAYISVPQQIGAVGDMSAAVSSAVTKFKTLGIDHVIVQDGADGVWAGDGLTLEWMNQAKSQNYYPRYGANTDNNPGASLNPSDEMNKELAIDGADYDGSYDKGWHTNAARQKCFQIEAQAGYPVASNNPNDEVIAGEYCDMVFFLQKIINGLSDLTTANFLQAAQSLGTSFENSIIYGSQFSPGRRDGGDEVRTEEYFSSCNCLQYQSTPYYAG